VIFIETSEIIAEQDLSTKVYYPGFFFEGKIFADCNWWLKVCSLTTMASVAIHSLSEAYHTVYYCWI